MSTWPARFVTASCLLVAIACVAFCDGCGTHVANPDGLDPQRYALIVVKASTNAAIDYSGTAERTEAFAAIDASTDQQDAAARIVTVKAKWDLIWLAIDALSVAHNDAAEKVNAGQSADLDTLRAAYCEVKGKLPTVIAIADWPLGGCK